MTKSEPGTPRPPSLWHNRDFMLLWSGQVLSILGTRMSSVAVPLVVLAMTGSAGKAGVAGFVSTLPYLLFYLPAGALVDRWDRRRVMLWSEAGRIVALGSIPVAMAATWLWVVLLPPMAAAPNLIVLAPLVAAMAFVGPVWNVVVIGYQYTVIPDEMLGRVKSVVLLVSWGTIPFGSLLAGGLLDVVTPAGAVLALCGLTLLVALIATISPGIRKATVLAGH
ncbi:MFS transporter [Kribbella sp. DT2]|uniref:MFS transporter n=1 Tax=Kribbella sp. DT2 TaxID=3393427 RepID=UPI003CEFE833